MEMGEKIIFFRSFFIYQVVCRQKQSRRLVSTMHGADVANPAIEADELRRSPDESVFGKDNHSSRQRMERDKLMTALTFEPSSQSCLSPLPKHLGLQTAGGVICFMG
jgi:hypothetical protein